MHKRIQNLEHGTEDAKDDTESLRLSYVRKHGTSDHEDHNNSVTHPTVINSPVNAESQVFGTIVQDEEVKQETKRTETIQGLYNINDQVVDEKGELDIYSSH